QLEDAAGRDLEAAGVEELGTDVRVEAEQIQLRGVEHAVHRLEGGAAGEGEAELLVLVRGGDELVRVRLDARGHPQHDPGAQAQPGGDLVDLVDLVERVDDDAAHPRLEGAADLRGGLVVPVQGDAGGGEPGAQRHGELAARAHVQAQPV